MFVTVGIDLGRQNIGGDPAPALPHVTGIRGIRAETEKCLLTDLALANPPLADADVVIVRSATLRTRGLDHRDLDHPRPVPKSLDMMPFWTRC